MFERETKFIYDFNLNKLNQLGPLFTLNELKKTGIHSTIVKYIDAEIDYLLFEDREKLLKNSAFDYTGEEVRKHFDSINSELKKTKRFSSQYIGELILNAVSFNINFLVKPRASLIRFIFDNQDNKTIFEIRQILQYVYYYDYQVKTIIKYMSKKKILSIGSGEFEDILMKIDKIGIESYPEKIVDLAVKSIADFFNIGGVNKSKIPINALELFLYEKELDVYARRLIANIIPDQNQRIDIKEIAGIFSNISDESFNHTNNDLIAKVVKGNESIELIEKEIPEDETAIAEVLSGLGSTKNDQKNEIIISTEKSDQSQTETANLIIENEALEPDSYQENEIPTNADNDWDLFKNSDSETDSKESVEESNTINNTFEMNTKKEEIYTKNENGNAEDSSKSGKNISDYIPKDKIPKIIEIIFDQDMEDFANTLEQIGDCKNYYAAESILNKLFTNNKINPTSKEAIILKNIAWDYFNQK